MKSVILLLSFVCYSLFTFGQEEDDYYKKPSQRSDVKNNAYPNLDRKSVNLYLGLEGGMEFNQSTVTNNPDNLIGKEKGKDLYWGLVLGYNMNDTWSIEAGYYKNPTYVIQAIDLGRSYPYILRLGTPLQTIPIRYKRKILTIDPITKNATIHVGAGILLSPDAADKKIAQRTFNGYSFDPQYPRDTIKHQIKSETFLSKRAVAQAEVLVELHGRVSNSLSIVVYARGNISPKGLVRSDVNYTINQTVVSKAQQLTNGISFNFGLVFRYNIMRGYKYYDQEHTE
ncbi:hypothetical protein [Emticicia agri]|uniref:Outer membrane protein beta-barrel domain-containing protein n=1 Tax=Emticicia agri TaxID=2492393 RepID=A0A4Q5M1N2_9BACT|nr:hypothetical protein [Emticicia agri]RYU95919.1 hypothetical protein EWM59_09880 [Emticicia agri]